VILYLHGFASGPGSTKGRALQSRFAARGVPFHRADLTPGEMGFERSTPLTMLAEAERLVAAHRPRVLMGSSLGAYLAAVLMRGPPEAAAPPLSPGQPPPAAPALAGIERIVLLAPAFRLFERWRGHLTPEEEGRWRQEGLEVWHHATQRKRRLGWGFMEEASGLPAYPDVHVPALCLAGRRDEVVPLEDVERFVALSPTIPPGGGQAPALRTARLVVLDDGHELLQSVDRIFEEAWAFLEPVLTG
jgi:pimeloyl-ACP methyl ester carboxylesterase